MNGAHYRIQDFGALLDLAFDRGVSKGCVYLASQLLQLPNLPGACHHCQIAATCPMEEPHNLDLAWDEFDTPFLSNLEKRCGYGKPSTMKAACPWAKSNDSAGPIWPTGCGLLTSRIDGSQSIKCHPPPPCMSVSGPKCHFQLSFVQDH